MFKKPILAIPVILLSTYVIADTNLMIVSQSVSSHPSVIEKANEITLKGISVDQILAENGLKINLSTKSKIPISHSLDANILRADDLDRKFLDGVVTLSKNLYDFGVVEYKTNAEILRKEALKLPF